MEHRELWRADGRLVMQLRRERGWSRARLAQKAAVSHHTAGKIERGEPVFPATLSRVATALGVTASALRVGGEGAPELPRGKRALVDAVHDRYELYRAAVWGGGIDLLRREFPKGLSRGVRWTYASTATVPFTGVYHGSGGVIRFFERMLPTCRVVEQHVEQIQPLGNREILANGTEVGEVVGIGTITAMWTHLYTFDRRGRAVAVRASFDFLSIEPPSRGSPRTLGPP